MGRIMLTAVLLAATAARADPALDSQLEAQRLLGAAVEAMGGEQAVRDLKSVRRDYLQDWVDVGQGQHPWSGAPLADQLPPHSGFDDSQAISYLDYAGDRYYEAIRHEDAPNDYALVVESGTRALAFQSIAYVRERPFHAEHASTDHEPNLLRRFRRYPEGLLRMALQRAETLVALAPTEEGDARLDGIAFADVTGSQIRVYFDARSHLPVRAATVRTHVIYGDTTSDTVYADYRRVGRLQLPFSVVTRVDGIPASRLTMHSIELDVVPEPEWFKPPGNPVSVVSPPDSPTVEPVGGGVYLIRGPYNLVFAEFRDHVLLVELPMSEAYAKTCLDLVAATVPGKPVRLVSTHFHFDHLGGVRTAVARGIPILTTPDARDVIQKSLGSRQAIHPDELARGPRAPVIEVAGDHVALDDGSQRVELHDFGPTPHVAHILVAWFPRLKLLHVADMLDVLTPEQVIAGVDTVVMGRRMRELGLDVERIVPVHGVPITRAQLDRGFEVRRKYEEPPR